MCSIDVNYTANNEGKGVIKERKLIWNLWEGCYQDSSRLVQSDVFLCTVGCILFLIPQLHNGGRCRTRLHSPQRSASLLSVTAAGSRSNKGTLFSPTAISLQWLNSKGKYGTFILLSIHNTLLCFISFVFIL
jgi:hypothetical protein